MKNSQIIITGIFVFFLIIGFLAFSGIIKIGGSKSTKSGATGTIVLWGTLPLKSLTKPIEDFNQTTGGEYRINYVEKNPASYSASLVESLASGNPPDAFLMSPDMILPFMNKIFVIPFASLSQANFQSSFVGADDIYLSSTGALALPLTIDPMVMYYNKTLFDAAGIANPPTYWDEFYGLADKLTIRDRSTNTIKQSVAPLGEFVNIDHAKEILATLFLELGNPIVAKENGAYVSKLNSDPARLGSNASLQALTFYTDFANPNNKAYSWNRGLTSSRSSFINGTLAIYFGYASELFDIQQSNPNLNFGVNTIPQVRNSSSKSTYASLTAVAFPKISKNSNSALIAISNFTKSAVLPELYDALSLPPVRREFLAQNPSGVYLPVFYKSALFAHSWIDPNPSGSSKIFKDMIENINSGISTPLSSMADASNQLDFLISGYNTVAK